MQSETDKIVSAPGLSPTERKLADDILCERMERFNSVNELWDKIHEIQQELAESGRPLLQGSQSTLGTAEDRSPGDFKQPELTALQRTVSEEGMKVYNTLQAMQRSQQDLQERLSKLERTVHTDSLERLSKPERTAPTAGLDIIQRHLDEAANLQERAPIDGMRDVSFEGEQDLQQLTQQVHKLVATVGEQADAVSSIRRTLVESSLNMPLQAISSSRMALRASELTLEQRQLALKSLSEKENSLRTNLAALTRGPPR